MGFLQKGKLKMFIQSLITSYKHRLCLRPDCNLLKEGRWWRRRGLLPQSQHSGRLCCIARLTTPFIHTAYLCVCAVSSAVCFIYMCVQLYICVCAKSLQLCLTLCHPMAVARRFLCPWGFSSWEYWSESPCRPRGDPSDLGIAPSSLTSPALAVDSSPLVPAGSPYIYTFFN